MLVASLLPVSLIRKWLGAFLRGIFNDNFIPLLRACRRDDQSMRGDVPGWSVSSSKTTPDLHLSLRWAKSTPSASPVKHTITWGRFSLCCLVTLAHRTRSWRDHSQEFVYGRMKSTPFHLFLPTCWALSLKTWKIKQKDLLQELWPRSWFSHVANNQALKKTGPGFAIQDELPVLRVMGTVVGWVLLQLGTCHVFLEKLSF